MCRGHQLCEHARDGVGELLHRRHDVGAHEKPEADVVGDLDWNVSVDSTINRAHQHATTLSRIEEPAGRRPKPAQS